MAIIYMAIAHETIIICDERVNMVLIKLVSEGLSIVG